jgi:hypothetical protein
MNIAQTGREPQVPPVTYALWKDISRKGLLNAGPSASLGMTNGGATLQSGSVAEQ